MPWLTWVTVFSPRVSLYSLWLIQGLPSVPLFYSAAGQLLNICYSLPQERVVVVCIDSGPLYPVCMCSRSLQNEEAPLALQCPMLPCHHVLSHWLLVEMSNKIRFFCHHRNEGKEEGKTVEGRNSYKEKGRFYILQNRVFSSVRGSCCTSGWREGLEEWEGTSQRNSPDFQKLDGKVQHGLDADKKFFRLLYWL